MNANIHPSLKDTSKLTNSNKTLKLLIVFIGIEQTQTAEKLAQYNNNRKELRNWAKLV